MKKFALSSRTPELDIILAQQNSASLAVTDGDTVHFLVTSAKSPNYMEHCNQVLVPDDPVSVVRQYTEHTSNLYAKVNLSLASDSATLKEHAKYIEDLRGAILSMPLLDDGPFFRGVDLSDLEIQEMEKAQTIFYSKFYVHFR